MPSSPICHRYDWLNNSRPKKCTANQPSPTWFSGIILALVYNRFKIFASSSSSLRCVIVLDQQSSPSMCLPKPFSFRPPKRDLTTATTQPIPVSAAVAAGPSRRRRRRRAAPRTVLSSFAFKSLAAAERKQDVEEGPKKARGESTLRVAFHGGRTTLADHEPWLRARRAGVLSPLPATSHWLSVTISK